MSRPEVTRRSLKGHEGGESRGMGLKISSLASIFILACAVLYGVPSPFPQSAVAQAQEAGEVPVLKPVVVTATRVEKPLEKVPAGAGVVEKSEIQMSEQTVGIDESLKKIPGLFLQNRFNFSQDLRISIRGFGARAAFGIRGIRVMVDGIPETMADGQSQVDNIDVGSIGRIEVLKGPSSSLYGNASGGVISIITEEGPPVPFSQEYTTTIGAFGFQKYQIKTGGQAGKLNYIINTSRLDYDGYRDHARAENFVLNSKFRLDIDDTSDLTFLLNYATWPKSEDPGGLSASLVEQDRQQAFSRNLTFNSGEELTQGKVGLLYRKRFLEDHQVSLSLYNFFRDFRARLPLNRSIDFDRLAPGAGIQYVYTGEVGGRPNRLTVGVDIQHQNDDRRNFGVVNGKIGGDLTLNQDERVTSVGTYIQEEFQMLDKLELTLGARYDRVRFTAEDFFITDTNPDDSGTRTLDELTPRIALLYSPTPYINLYGNISTSFETPTTTELTNRPGGEGGFNPALEPKTATQYEVGAKGSYAGRLSYDLALFLIRVKDELIPFESELQPGRRFFRNAGSSEHRGIELGVGYEILQGLRAYASYTLSDFFYRDFKTEDSVFDGNDIPGIPPSQWYGEVSYRHPTGFYGSLEGLWVDGFFVNDSNTAKNDSYFVADLKLGYNRDMGAFSMRPFLGVYNLFDEKYNGNVRVNAFGRRYFEPAPAFNIFGGLTVAYNF